MAISGTWIGGTIYKAYFSGPNFREYPHNSYGPKYGTSNSRSPAIFYFGSAKETKKGGALQLYFMFVGW